MYVYLFFQFLFPFFSYSSNTLFGNPSRSVYGKSHSLLPRFHSIPLYGWNIIYLTSFLSRAFRLLPILCDYKQDYNKRSCAFVASSRYKNICRLRSRIARSFIIWCAFIILMGTATLFSMEKVPKLHFYWQCIRKLIPSPSQVILAFLIFAALRCDK